MRGFWHRVRDPADHLVRAEEVGEIFPDVDDTDELDPTGEFEAWKLRELMRIKRDKEALYACVRHRLRLGWVS